MKLRAMKFLDGDRVQSHPDSGDVKSMKAVWVGKIHKTISANDEGGCYETLGKWYPIKDENGKVHPLWNDYCWEKEELTLRQLWGSHLVEESGVKNWR